MRSSDKVSTTIFLALGVIFLLGGLTLLAFGFSELNNEDDPNTTDEDEGDTSGFFVGLCCGGFGLIVGGFLAYQGWKNLGGSEEPQYQQPHYQQGGPPHRRMGHPSPFQGYDSSAGPHRREAPAQQTQVIIQNIGEYIAGGKVDIQDSVVQRSEIGTSTNAGINVGNRQQALKEFEHLLETVWEDGHVSQDEYRLLKIVRESKSISPADYKRIEERVKSRMAAKNVQACPDCSSELQYVKDYEAWYCWECKEYKE
jgi:hypothetical protein